MNPKITQVAESASHFFSLPHPPLLLAFISPILLPVLIRFLDVPPFPYPASVEKEEYFTYTQN
jgi:hypothetical protein